MALHAELHRHLGGAIVPRIFWRYLQRHSLEWVVPGKTFDDFERWITAPRGSLSEYLELHKLFERAQTLQALPYFIPKLVRGAYVFEGICYMELRYSPYLRTDSLAGASRIAQMQEIVETIGELSHIPEYPVVVKQILCFHSALPAEVNEATLELASRMSEYVCGVDLAGPDEFYRPRLEEWTWLMQRARYNGLKTTGHCYETSEGCLPELLPFLHRIGHGIQIPLRYPELLEGLAERNTCLEVCPTTYLKTGTISSLSELKPVFERCREAGVDVVLGTDNAGIHNVRLPMEFENLLSADVITFAQMREIQEASFRHAFAWPHESPQTVLDDLVVRVAR